MAMMASSTSLHFSNPFPSSLKKTSPHHHPERTTAVDPESEGAETAAETTDPDSFEDRLKQVRLRYKSGTGKKAELRKSKKPTTSKRGSNGGGNVLLPPVPLKEPASRGMKVEFGFSPYTERLNGRLAGLGLAALLLVELGSGSSVLRYHGPAIVFLQIYFVAAVSAVFVKYEKERISIWPRSQTSPPL